MKIKIVFFLIIVSLFIQADELFIFGNKTFDVKNVSQSGDFTRFFLENPDLKRGNVIEQSLRLKMMGEIARGISINAVFDDTKVQNDNHEITLFLTNGNVKGAFGDILTSFSHSDIIFFNKKTRGMELTDKNEKFYFLYALSEGKIYSEVFTGKGMLQEYRMFFYPLVRGSETVILDGKKLVKGTDYDIDYEDGSIFIETHLLPVESTSTLFINYEYMEDEKAFKRHVRGLSFRDYNSKYKIDYGLSFFVEEDSKKKLIEDDDNSLKPSSNSIWSFYTGLEKNNFSFDFEKAFGEKDNNLYSDVLAVDKPLKSENQHFNLRWKNNNLNLVSKFIKREPGFEIIGKKESDIKIDEKTSVLNFKDRLKSFSFEKSDIESIIYVDPFFGLTGNSPTVFNSSKDEFTYSFGNKVKVTGYERNNENLSSDNVLYNGKNSNLKLVVKQSSIFEYFFSKFTDVLENVTSGTHSKNIDKNEFGFNFNGNNTKLAYAFSDIVDKSEKISNHDINLQVYSDKMNTNISLKLREEENNKSNSGDVNLMYYFDDFLSAQIRYSSSNIIQLKDTQEVSTANNLYNYKIDYVNDYLSASAFTNKRDRINKSTSLKENINYLENLALTWTPQNDYSYKLKKTMVESETVLEGLKVGEDKLQLEVVKNISMYSNISLSVEKNEKFNSKTPAANFDEYLYSAGYRNVSGKWEINTFLKTGTKKQVDGSKIDVMVFGDELRYNIDRMSNVRYRFSLRNEKKDISRTYSDEELSFNRNINFKTALKFYLTRKDVAQDENGGAYKTSIFGFSFDTNF